MKITLVAGEIKPVTVAGGQFYLLDAFGKMSVKIVGGGDAREFELSAGMGFKIRGDERFFALDIKNISGVDQTIEFEISDRDVFDNRTVGIVEVVNADKARTDFDSAFLLTRRCSGLAAVYSNVALRNPVGSGKNVYVNQIVATAEAVQVDCILQRTPTLAADELSAGVTGLLPGSVNGISKRVAAGAPAGVSLIDVFYSNALSFGNMLAVQRVYIAAYSYFNYRFTEPFKLEPGAGLLLTSFTPNTLIAGNFEFFEEVIS